LFASRRRALSLFLTQIKGEFRGASLRAREYAAQTNDSALAMTVLRRAIGFETIYWTLRLENLLLGLTSAGVDPATLASRLGALYRANLELGPPASVAQS
jgi:hypothetical protein